MKIFRLCYPLSGWSGFKIDDSLGVGLFVWNGKYMVFLQKAFGNDVGNYVNETIKNFLRLKNGFFPAFDGYPHFYSKFRVYEEGYVPFVKIRVGSEWVYEIVRNRVGGTVNVVDKSLFFSSEVYRTDKTVEKGNSRYPSAFEIRWDDMIIIDLDIVEMQSGGIFCVVVYLVGGVPDARAVGKIFNGLSINESLEVLKQEIESEGYVNWSDVPYTSWVNSESGIVPISVSLFKMGDSVYLSLYGVKLNSQNPETGEYRWVLYEVIEKADGVEYNAVFGYA
jgi:hypothetical protein